MAQHDLIIDNAGGAVVRADINAALAALGSSMKGSDPPSSPLAGMLWLEEDNPSATQWTLKIYDGADWIAIGVVNATSNVFTPSTLPGTGVLKAGDTMTGALAVPSLAVAGDVTASSVNSGPLAGFRNSVINGNFQIAQRGAAFVAGANNDDSYTLDRWYVLSDGNDVVDITQSTTEVPASGSQTSIALDVETVNKKFGIAQIIEQRNCQSLIGNTVTLSFKAKVSSTTKLDNVKAAIVAWSGTADTVTSDIISVWGAEGTNPTFIANATYENIPTNLNVTTSWATYSVTAAVDTTSTSNIVVFIWSDVTDTTAGDFLYITDVQLEGGSVGTPFERRPIGTELALCQRYYCETRASGRFFSGGSGHFSENHIRWPVVMRAAPTVTVTSGGIRSNLLSGYPQIQSASIYGARWLVSSNASGDCYAVNETITAAIEL